MVGYDADEYDQLPRAQSTDSRGIGGHAVTLIIIAVGLSVLWPTWQAEPRQAELRTVDGVLSEPVHVSSSGRHDFFDTSAGLSIQEDGRPTGEVFSAELRDLRKLWRITGPTEGLANLTPGTRLRVGVTSDHDSPIIMELSVGEQVIVTFEQALAAQRESRRNARVLGGGVVVLAVGLVAWPLIRTRRQA